MIDHETVASRTETQGDRKSMSNRTPAPAIDAESLELLIEMIGPDEPAAILDLLDTYLGDSTRQVETLQASFSAGDYKNVHRIAHSMKSSSATFGALELSRYCERLERLAKDNCVNGDCEGQLALVRSEHERVIESLRGERARFGA
jgi:HPt (histidine-containing phosphotransfer) domain-containing protein